MVLWPVKGQAVPVTTFVVGPLLESSSLYDFSLLLCLTKSLPSIPVTFLILFFYWSPAWEKAAWIAKVWL